MPAPRLNAEPLTPGQRVKLLGHFTTNPAADGLGAQLPAGAAVTAIPLASPLLDNVLAGAVVGIAVGTAELDSFTVNGGGAAAGAMSIPVASQAPAFTHQIGDTVAVLIDPATVTLVIEQPDRTTLSPALAPTKDSTGVYHAFLTVAQSGRRPYFGKWVGTDNLSGVGQSTQPFTLTVDPDPTA
jgi:hypothetical protein